MSSSEGLEPLLLALCKAIKAQTQAITALAQSNERLADSMIAPDETDPDEPTTYMDGTPIN